MYKNVFIGLGFLVFNELNCQSTFVEYLCKKYCKSITTGYYYQCQ